MGLFSLEDKRVYVAGHTGMVGSALSRRLEASNCRQVHATRSELDLRVESQVARFFGEVRPQVVFLSAAKVGGIRANNSFPVDFLEDNLRIELNIIRCAHEQEVEKLVFLGSSCIYPKFAEQPIKENQLLTGPLEPTNEWYAIAKIAGIKLCQAYQSQYGDRFISAMPCNLYGYGDNFDLDTSHVLPALIHKAHIAKLRGLSELEVWGTGKPKREFLFADDAADAMVFLCENYDEPGHVNVGYGSDLEIRQLVEIICSIVGYRGQFVFNDAMPDGTLGKLMDSSYLNSMGWRPSIDIEDGIQRLYQWYLNNQVN